ncbi:MAG: hypothetical protein QM765_43510 [Myxococcales bacterium]
MKTPLALTAASIFLLAGCTPPATDPTPNRLQCGSQELHSKVSTSCSAMDATAAADESGGHCFCALGFAWDGKACVGLGDCACVGADCDKLTQTLEECQAKHSGCSQDTRLVCGSSALHANVHQACGAMDAQASADTTGAHCNCMLGYAWNGQDCVGLGDCACVGADCDKLETTREACLAKHTTCKPTFQCGSSALNAQSHDACGAMDAQASGDAAGTHCYCLLGYAWDGKDCVGLGDCACVGTDCDKLETTREACLAKHTSCAKPSIQCGSSALNAQSHDVCGAMDAQAAGDGSGAHCNCMLGYAWNGSDCVGLGDCACVGADCDKLETSRETCLAKHQSCK